MSALIIQQGPRGSSRWPTHKHAHTKESRSHIAKLRQQHMEVLCHGAPSKHERHPDVLFLPPFEPRMIKSMPLLYRGVPSKHGRHPDVLLLPPFEPRIMKSMPLCPTRLWQDALKMHCPQRWPRTLSLSIVCVCLS